MGGLEASMTESRCFELFDGDDRTGDVSLKAGISYGIFISTCLGVDRALFGRPSWGGVLGSAGELGESLPLERAQDEKLEDADPSSEGAEGT